MSEMPFPALAYPSCVSKPRESQASAIREYEHRLNPDREATHHLECSTHSCTCSSPSMYAGTFTDDRCPEFQSGEGNVSPPLGQSARLSWITARVEKRVLERRQPVLVFTDDSSGDIETTSTFQRCGN